MTDGLPDGSTDEFDYLWIERTFPGILIFRKFHPAILMGIFTINLAGGWTDRSDDGNTDGWKEFQMESLLG